MATQRLVINALNRAFCLFICQSGIGSFILASKQKITDRPGRAAFCKINPGQRALLANHKRLTDHKQPV